MNYTVSLKNTTLDYTTATLIERYAHKLNHKLQNFKEGVARLSIVIKKHHRHHFYSGLLTLSLPTKPVTVTIGEHDLELLLKNGFDKLNRAYETYKGKKFKGSSKYNRPALGVIYETSSE